MDELKVYFDQTQGLGILSTANAEGKVDSAVYTKPYFLDDGMIAFIMRDKLTHANLNANPYATYLFKENGDKYVGKRLYLKKFDESDDSALIEKVKQLSFHVKSDENPGLEKLFLVLFQLENVLPLVGMGD